MTRVFEIDRSILHPVRSFWNYIACRTLQWIGGGFAFVSCVLAGVVGFAAPIEGPRARLSSAEGSKVENPRDFRDQGQRALDEGIPDAAVLKFKQALSMNPSADERAALSLKLAQALVAASRPAEALEVLQNAGGIPGTDAEFVKAQVFAALGKWAEAQPLFHEAIARPEFSIAAKLGEAEALRALNRTPQAIQILESIAPDAKTGTTAKLRLADFYIDQKQPEKCAAILRSVAPASASGQKWKAYAEGRLLLAQGETTKALAVFEGLIKDSRDVSENLLFAVTMGAADATATLSGPEMADNYIEDFIWHNPESGFLELAFRKLDEIYAVERNPTESELQKWTEQKQERRAALAQFYLAKMLLHEKRLDRAVRRFDAFARTFPSHPLAASALLFAGKIRLEERKFDDAVRSFDEAARRAADKELLGEIELAAGLAHFARLEFVLASSLFRSASGHSPKLAETGLFDSALAWLNEGNYDKFLEDYKELSTRFPESDLRRELILEEGLKQARERDKRAEKTLRLFIKDFPEHRRVPEARVALAEIAFLSSPQNLQAASAYLRASNESKPQDAESAERAEYLAIFLADAPDHRDEEKAIKLCEQFIAQHAKSKLLPDVRMKLGQIYFRNEDFPRARTQFETLANEATGAPAAETALFLAGKSAMRMLDPASSERAIELFEAVAKLNGPLKLYARQEQAIAKSLAGKESEAVILYNDILSGKPDDELRFSALCGKGDNLFAMGNGEPKFFDEAIAAFQELSEQPNVSAHWRNEALYKKGKCLEKLGKNAEALGTFYDVLRLQGEPGAGPEHFWYYKAGFDAARLLETQQQWKSAIGIYQKMANAPGPRAQEAKTRATQMRLEHFIWED
jgi:outer membrane protein assembly factor BamD (BamD/ComL family)